MTNEGGTSQTLATLRDKLNEILANWNEVLKETI